MAKRELEPVDELEVSESVRRPLMPPFTGLWHPYRQ